ncbi:MAG: DUF3368 domain-containing protein [Verrucomicrobia bacterium]|nr:DUF3368 domain-containing protein [Verrucomicrobiota bacterium]
MRVVSNTSPLSNLTLIGRLELLKRRYGSVHIQVEKELSALSHPQARASLASALSEGWLKVEQAVPPTPFSLPLPLDAGESAALALAAATQADVLLIDEKQGRSAARQLGLPIGGLLGELIHARQQGWIPELRSEIRRLREDAGFFVTAELELFLLTQVGE